MARRFLEEKGWSQEILDTSNWKGVNINLLDKDVQNIFEDRKLAVDTFLKTDVPISKIIKMTNIKRQNLYRLIERCLSIHKDGDLYGYRALIPYIRVNKPSNVHSVFYILQNHPNIKKQIDGEILGKVNAKGLTKEKAISIKNIHRHFLKECLEAGISTTDYPFNLKTRGLYSFYNYANSLLNTSISASAGRISEDSKRKAINSGIGIQDYKGLPIEPMGSVQFDGHKIDAYFTIDHQMPDGSIKPVVISRIWILAVLDVVTRCVLGYYITYGSEYSSDDVIKTIIQSMKEWQPKHLTIPNLKYNDGAGFPNHTISEAKNARFKTFYLDNGMSNLGNRVKDFIIDKLHAAYCLGPVANPMRRGHIERFFRRLTEEVIQRLPSTTGSNPKDIKRQDPQKNATKYNVNVKQVEEILDVWIANYNNTPHSGLNGKTPLQTFQDYLDSGFVLQTYPDNQWQDFLIMEFTRTIIGNKHTGTRPYVNFERVRYTSEFLRQSPHLIGKKVLLKVNPDDIRKIKIFLVDSGEEIGTIQAIGAWSISPHSLDLRKQIWNYDGKEVNKHMFHVRELDDPVEAFTHFLNTFSRNNDGSPNPKAIAKIENIKKKEKENLSTVPTQILEQSDHLTTDKKQRVSKSEKEDFDTLFEDLPKAFITNEGDIV